MGADKLTRRAPAWCPAAALQRLTRVLAIACALRLAAKHHAGAEPVIITLTEHWLRCLWVSDEVSRGGQGMAEFFRSIAFKLH